MSRIKLPHCWDRWMKEGDMLFKYMLHGFETLLDGDTNIKHFDICVGFKGLRENAAVMAIIKEIKNKFTEELQRDLIVWIRRQIGCMDLFLSRNWRPFGNPKYSALMFLGYSRLFVWKKYYFQLILASDCENSNECRYCKDEGSSVHFAIGFFGWKEEGRALLQPLNKFVILPDNFVPSEVWYMV
jgi:hypothetical protein